MTIVQGRGEQPRGLDVMIVKAEYVFVHALAIQDAVYGVPPVCMVHSLHLMNNDRVYCNIPQIHPSPLHYTLHP